MTVILPNQLFKRFCLGHLNYGDSNLPFDLAQGGEPVEPFRISANFIKSGEFRISGLSGLGCLTYQNHLR
jgi:hypothetical protein